VIEKDSTFGFYEAVLARTIIEWVYEADICGLSSDEGGFGIFVRCMSHRFREPEIKLFHEKSSYQIDDFFQAPNMIGTPACIAGHAQGLV